MANDDQRKVALDRIRQNIAEHGHHVYVVSGGGDPRKVHMSWATTLLLGALDFYQVREIPALQIVPDEAHWTSDVPVMTAPWSAITAPVWRGLHEPWAYPVPANSVAVTNPGALRGERVAEAVRWEEDE